MLCWKTIAVAILALVALPRVAKCQDTMLCQDSVIAAIVLGVALGIVSTILAIALIRFYCGQYFNSANSSCNNVEEVAGEDQGQNAAAYFSTSTGGREQHLSTKEVKHNALYTGTDNENTIPGCSDAERIPEAVYFENEGLQAPLPVKRRPNATSDDSSTRSQSSHLASHQTSPNQSYAATVDVANHGREAGTIAKVVPSFLHNKKWKLPTLNKEPAPPARTTSLANTISPSHLSVADVRGNTDGDAVYAIPTDGNVYSMADDFPGGLQALYSSIQK